jgi:ABC-2 type transport system ATP-binding protein
MSAILIEDLVVHYSSGMFGKRSQALHGISLKVDEGEVVGFLGPNGAGKSTTIKTLLGFVFPTSGKTEILGSPVGSAQSRKRLGYLPEVALYYPFLTARETLTMYGRLMNMGGAQLRDKVMHTLKLVGLAGKEDVRLKHFSKGMQQRVGIGQAILGEPELLIFDELSSGLDPVGRRDLRLILQRLRDDGRTIFFSSHELSEVELLCDRILILNKGKMVLEEPLEKVLASGETRFIRVRSTAPPPGGDWRLMAEGIYEIEMAQPKVKEALASIAQCDAEVLEVGDRRGSLEDFFVQIISNEEKGGGQ